MVFKPATQYQMPNDPAGPLQVATKQYSDAGDAARAPATHASQHASGASDPISPLSIGAVQGVAPTSTKTANWPASIGELVMADATNGAFTVTLPTITANGQRVGVKRLDAAAANVLTVAAAAGNTVGSVGAASMSIILQDQAAVFQANGSNWVIVDGYQSLSTLDARYSAGSTDRYTVTDVTGTGQSVQLVTNSGTYRTAVWDLATADATMVVPTDMAVGARLVVLTRAVNADRAITPSGLLASLNFSNTVRTVASGKTGVWTFLSTASGVMIAGYDRLA